MAPSQSRLLSLSAKGAGGGGRLSPREALLLASGVVGGAMVASHLYFLLRRKGATASLCSFLQLLRLAGADGGGLEGGMDPATGRLIYPKTARGSVVETLHGVAVPDPYRWLEDPDAKAVRAWVAAQNKTTDAYFETVKGEKEKFRARMNELVRGLGGGEGGEGCGCVGMAVMMTRDGRGRWGWGLAVAVADWRCPLLTHPVHHTTVPLRQVLVHVAEGEPLLLLQEGRPPEPERPLHPGGLATPRWVGKPGPSIRPPSTSHHMHAYTHNTPSASIPLIIYTHHHTITPRTP